VLSGPAGRFRRRRRHVVAATALSGALTLLASVAAPAAVADGSRADGPHAKTWWYDAMKLDQVHRQATGKGVTVAIIDDGMQPNIPSLAGADIKMMPSPCLQGADGPRRPVRDPSDRSIHGGEMAAYVVGNGDGPGGRGTGVKGVAPDARVLVYDLDDERLKEPAGGAFTCSQDDMGATILAALRAGADIISMSWGIQDDVFGLGADIKEAVAANKAVLVAANNDTAPEHRGRGKKLVMPSDVPGVVSVNALDQTARPWKDSLTLWEQNPGVTENWYAPVISAPGVKLEAPGTAEADDTNVRSTGTSAATALVAGSLAVVKEKYPRATPNQLIQNLVHHTTDDDHPDDTPDLTWVRGYGFGIASPLNMLQHDPTRWPDENPLPGDPTKLAQRYPTSLETAPPKAADSASPASEQGASGEDRTEEARSDKAAVREESEDSASAGTWVWVVAAAVLLLLALGAVLTLVLRRRREASGAAHGHQTHTDIEHDLHQTGGR
jgi:hypothetical protein